MLMYNPEKMKIEFKSGVNRSKSPFYLWLTARYQALCDAENGPELLFKTESPIIVIDSFDDVAFDSCWFDYMDGSNGLKQVMWYQHKVPCLNRATYDLRQYFKLLSETKGEVSSKSAQDYINKFNEVASSGCDVYSWTTDEKRFEDIRNMPTRDLLSMFGVKYVSSRKDPTSRFNNYWMLPGLDEVILGIAFGFLYVGKSPVFNSFDYNGFKLARGLEVFAGLELAIRVLYHLDDVVFEDNKIIVHEFEKLPCKTHLCALYVKMATGEAKTEIAQKVAETVFYESLSSRAGLEGGFATITECNYDGSSSPSQLATIGVSICMLSKVYEKSCVSYISDDVYGVFKHIAFVMEAYHLFDTHAIDSMFDLKTLAHYYSINQDQYDNKMYNVFD